MKKLLSLFIAASLFVSFKANATIDTVTVQNFQFTPSFFNICLGDTLRFVWVSGFHNVHITSPIDSMSNDLQASGNFFEYTPTAAGTYSFNCDYHASMMMGTFNVNQTPSINLGGILNPSCNGGTNGLVDIIASGGSPFTFLWSNGATTEDISNLTAGTYTVIANNGCGADTFMQTLTEPTAIAITVNLVTDATTCGSSDGAIDISAAGGTGAFTYSWMPGNGATEDTLLISAGVYTVTVTDANGCTTDSAITVNSIIPTVVDLGPDTVQCGGSVTLDAGNTTGSTFLWNTGATTQIISAAASGTYYVNVMNNCGTFSDTVMVTIQSMLVVDLGADTAWCGSGMLDAGNAGASYLWSTGATTQTIAVSVSDTFYVDVTNSCGTFSDTVIISVNPAPVISAGSNATICAGNSAMLCATGGLNYAWFPSGQSTSCILVSLTATTSYLVIGTDANGCTGSDTVTVYVAGPSASTSSTPATCGMWDGSATVNATGGASPYNYLWNTSPPQTTQTATGLFSGTYTVCVTDASGCQVCATAMVGTTGTALQSTFAAGNNHRGNMFDVTAINNVMITSFDGHPMANTSYEIYYKVGTYLGSENNSSAWTPVGSAASVIAQPMGTPTPLPIVVNVTIPAGQTYAFYITSSNITVSQYYTNGTGAGNIYAQDANIQFKEGCGLEYPFLNTPFTPRVWNGVIHYCTGPVGTESTLSTEKEAVNVFPNPSNGEFTVSGLQPGAKISVTNTLGQVVFEKTAAQKQEAINLEKASGVYFYKVTDAAGTAGSGKLVVE